MNNSNYVKRYRTIERYCNVEKLKISRKDDLSTNYNDISSDNIYCEDTYNIDNESNISDFSTDNDVSSYSSSDNNSILSDIQINTDMSIQYSLDNNNYDITFSQELISLIQIHNVSHNFTDKLLKLLKKNGHPELPLTCRTLLNTSRNNIATIKSDVQYIYLNFKKMLILNVERYDFTKIKEYNTIPISLNLDGLPLFNSRNLSLWPLLVSINIDPVQVFPSCLTLGVKPKNLDFIEDSIVDILQLINDGVIIRGKYFKLDLQCIACDAPAKCFFKQTLQFNGYHGCDRCNQISTKCILNNEKKGRNIYSKLVFTKRTDYSFRNKSDAKHLIGTTPLLKLPVDMITIFSVDYMHCVLLGVCRKLVRLWLTGCHQKGKRVNSKYRLSNKQKDSINDKLILFKQFIPREFSRKPRNLSEFDKWKASEIRLFLLYLGKIILKNIIHKEYYDNFMLLSVAISMLVSNELTQSFENIETARCMLVLFVKESITLYGDAFAVYNVHSLLHLHEDAFIHGSIEKCSCFVFENYLQKLKYLVKSGKNTIVELSNRIQEQIKMPIRYDSLNFNNKKNPNNCFFINNKYICEVLEDDLSLDVDYATHSKCRIYNRKWTFYVRKLNKDDLKIANDFDTSILSCYESNIKYSEIKIIDNNDIKHKGLIIKNLHNYHNNIVFMKLLHT